MSLGDLALLLRERTGLEVGYDRLEALKDRLEVLAAPRDWPSWLADLRQQPVESPAVQQVLELVAVTETFFFRDEAQFEALQSHVLPRLIEENSQRRQLNLLSLGCSTGEEPYSLAILVQGLLPSGQAWQVSLVGADICAANLKAARQGIFRSWSFRGVVDDVRQRFFLPHGADWQLLPEVRELVRFALINVIQGIGPYRDSLDLILWRHMAIYFPPELRRRVLGHCERALRPGGYLMVGASEMGQLGETTLEPRQVGQTWLYQRPRPAPSRGRTAAAVLQPKGASLRQLYQDSRPALATRACPPPLSDIGRARQLADQGRYDQARAACQGLPPDLESCYLLAQIEEATGQPEAAERCLRQALKLDRDFIIGHFMLALSYSRRGMARRATSHLQRVLRLLAEQPPGGVVPHSEGRTVADLRQTVTAVLAQLEGL